MITGPTAIDADLLLQHTGQQAVTSLDQASKILRDAASENREAQHRLWMARWRGRAAWCRRFAARFGTVPILDALAVSTVLALGISLALIWAGLADVVVLAAVLFSCFGIVGVLLTWFLHGNYSSKAHRLQEATADLRRAAAAVAWFKPRAAATKQAATDAKALLDGLRAAAVAMDRRVRKLDEIDALLRVDCRLLSGDAFEQHLEVIFKLHGYNVARIGQSGDQGTDLIVQRPGGLRFAVQAKCYSGSVGNDAVQQVYAGMAFHGCQACALITNSYATRSATELAVRVNCRIIDGQVLPELIRGNVVL